MGLVNLAEAMRRGYFSVAAGPRDSAGVRRRGRRGCKRVVGGACNSVTPVSRFGRAVPGRPSG